MQKDRGLEPAIEDLHIVITRCYFFSLKCSGFSLYLANSFTSITSIVTPWVGSSMIPAGRACALYCLLFKRTSFSCNLSANTYTFWPGGNSGQKTFFSLPTITTPIPTPGTEQEINNCLLNERRLTPEKYGSEVLRLSLQEHVSNTRT